MDCIKIITSSYFASLSDIITPMSNISTSYKTILKEAEGEIVEKKSRFICNLYHIETEEEASKIVESLKKQHYQARHVCHAYVLGADGKAIKYSDDGEPSGTAGRPMLDILTGRELTYTLACVTRYFGGVLLGTGGLVRAYSDALLEALENATIETMELKKQLQFQIDYQTIGKLKYSLPSYNANIISEDYGENINLLVGVSAESENNLRKYLTEVTGGKIVIEALDDIWCKK